MSLSHPIVDEPILRSDLGAATLSYTARACKTSGAMFLQDYYGQLRENNWSLYTDFKGFVGARYDL